MPASLSPRHRAIIDTIRGIPPGRVASYGQVAALSGCAGRARLVGWTLRHLTEGIELPWHRVLRADGAIALPAGSSGHVEQTRRLRRERVEVVRGRVDLARYGWRRSLDEMLWAPPSVAAKRGKRPAMPAKTPGKRPSRAARASA
jgi:methylated-DNA-protein-cysteine methyltransferase-like protein